MLCEAVFHFADGLRRELAKVDADFVERDRAGGNLGSFNQIFNQAFEPPGFFIEHADIFLRGLVLNVAFFEQIHIRDNRSQRRFQIVRDVGNQFGFHAFAFERFFNRRGFGLLRGRKVLGKRAQGLRHALRIQNLCGFTVMRFLGGGYDFVERNDVTPNQNQADDIKQNQ